MDTSEHNRDTSERKERAHSVHHPDLQAVVAAWPQLSAPIRARIVRMIEVESGTRYRL